MQFCGLFAKSIFCFVRLLLEVVEILLAQCCCFFNFEIASIIFFLCFVELTPICSRTEASTDIKISSVVIILFFANSSEYWGSLIDMSQSEVVMGSDPLVDEGGRVK